MKRAALIIFLVLSFFFSLAVSTNVFAAALHYTPILGRPQFGRWYEPFHILYWLATLRAPGGQYWLGLFAFALPFGLLAAIGLRIYRGSRLKLQGLYGHARWATLPELRREGLLRQGSGAFVLGQTAEAKIVRQTPTGAILRKPGSAPALRLAKAITTPLQPFASGNPPRGPSYRLIRSGKNIYSSDDKHVVVVAPTRGGKGVAVIIPTLFAWLESVIVYDMKGENFEITSGWRRQFSHVIRFEPADPGSARYNPFDDTPNDKTAIAAMQNFCESIPNPDGAADSPHWRESAIPLLVGVGLYMLYANPPDKRNLPALFNAFNDPDKPLRPSNPFQPSTLTDMLENQHPDPDCRLAIAQCARNYLQKPPNEFGSIVSTAIKALTIYQDPILARNVSSSDFRIRDLVDRDHSVSLYICVGPNDTARMRPLVRLLYEQVINTLTRRLETRKHRLALIYDEAHNLGRLEVLERALPYMAGYGLKAMIVVQNFGQIWQLYGRNSSILDNCHYKVILGVGSYDEARYVSDSLGTYSVNKRTVSHGGAIGTITDATRSTSETEAQAHLMTPDDVMRLPDTELIILRRGEHAYRAKKVPYYLENAFSMKANLPTIRTYQDQLKELPSYVPVPELPASEEPKQLPAPSSDPPTSRPADPIPTYTITIGTTSAPKAVAPPQAATPQGVSADTYSPAGQIAQSAPPDKIEDIIEL